MHSMSDDTERLYSLRTLLLITNSHLRSFSLDIGSPQSKAHAVPEFAP